MGLKNSKDDHYIHVLLIIGIYLFAGVNLDLGTPCGEEAKKRNYPMVNFCSDTDVTIEAVNILVDGYSLSTSSAVKSCTCVARATLEHASELFFKNILISSPLHDGDCKSKVVFNQDPSNENSQSCLINGSMTFDVTKDIEITLIKETRSADTRYCFYISLDQSNALQITCNQTFLWMNSSTESHTEGTTLQNIDNVEILERSEPPYHSTTAHQEISTQTYTLNFDDTDRLRNDDEESPKILYIIIGSGFGGTLLFVIIVICLIKKIKQIRIRKLKAENSQEQQYADIGSRELENRYSTIQQPYQNQQQYDQVA